VNGTEPKIEIFKPFEEAFELTKKILFQPFDLGKWCVIGFAAFLAGGANFSFGFRFPFSGGNWNFRSSSYASSGGAPFLQGEQMQWWIIALIAVVFLIVFLVVLVLSWIKARGVFIFTDCVVHNRAAIVEPWKEFRREGNSFFLFTWLIVLLFLAIVAVAALAFILPIILAGKDANLRNVSVIIGLSLFCAIVFSAAIVWSLIAHFMVPIMYRRRCRAALAFRASVSLIMTYPAPIILYFLFLILLVIGCGVIGCVTTCLTCCIAALPYVGTVILLPIFVLLRSFLLRFLRQFGSDYDVWAGVQQAEPPVLPPSPEPPLPA
jgi:hypothetical protein